MHLTSSAVQIYFYLLWCSCIYYNYKRYSGGGNIHWNPRIPVRCKQHKSVASLFYWLIWFLTSEYKLILALQFRSLVNTKYKSISTSIQVTLHLVDYVNNCFAPNANQVRLCNLCLMKTAIKSSNAKATIKWIKNNNIHCLYYNFKTK